MGGFHLKSLSLRFVSSLRSANTSSVLPQLVVLDALAQLFFLIKSFYADDTASLFRFTRETSIHQNPPPPSNLSFSRSDCGQRTSALTRIQNREGGSRGGFAS